MRTSATAQQRLPGPHATWPPLIVPTNVSLLYYQLEHWYYQWYNAVVRMMRTSRVSLEDGP